MQESIFPPVLDTAVDSLLWAQDPDEHIDDKVIAGQCRLFSTGSSANVTEWDLERGTVKRQSTGNFAEVWCLAAQPRAKQDDGNTKAQDLVAGCGDGTIVLLTTADEDLQFKRMLARVSGKKARCLTITYQKPEIVVAGFADSMIRVFDTRSGANLRVMSLGIGMPGAPKTTLVWKVVCLPNGDIVSADSNGEVRVWDGKTLSMIQRLRAHERDCLDIAIKPDGKAFMTSGVDGRLAYFQQAKTEGRTSWSKLSHRRVAQHRGPLKALAAFDSPSMSVVVAGGSDQAPVVMPLREFGKQNPRSLPALPQQPQVISAAKARLVVSWWEKSVSIYKIARQNTLEALNNDNFRVRQIVAKVHIDGDDSIRHVAISPAGNILAVATSSAVKVFQLKRRSMDTEMLAVRRLVVPNDLGGARLLAISPDANWLAIVNTENELKIARFDVVPGKPKLLRLLGSTQEMEKPANLNEEGAFQPFDQTVTKLVISADSTAIVLGTLSGFMHSWILNGEYDADAEAVEKQSRGNEPQDSDDSDDDEEEIVFYGQRWLINTAPALPRIDAAPLVMLFRPPAQQELLDSQLGVESSSDRKRLVVISARHQLYDFDLNTGRLSEWSRRNPSTLLPSDFTVIRDRTMDAMWDSRGRIWLYGSTFVFMLDIENDLIDDCGSAKKRKSDDQLGNHKKKKVEGRIQENSTEGKTRNATTTGGDDNELEQDGIDETHSMTKVQSHQRWSTFKYRPILGIVPFQDAGSRDEDVLEVVIVERPAATDNGKS